MTNLQLCELISSLVDMFIFVETKLHKPTNTSSLLPNYDVISHLAKRKTCRRGISVFYSSKIRYRITTDFISKKFDIIWLRLKLQHKDQIFCFFYAPGANHPDEDITSFYDDFREGYQRYPDDVEIFIMGDSYARLG